MKKGTLSVALAVCLAALNAGTVSAQTQAGAPADHEIRVVNGYGTAVRVYVQDARGGLYMLGRVAVSDFKIMKVPAAVAARGVVHIEVYPVQPFEALAPLTDGIATRSIRLNGADAVNLYLESDLLRSVVEIANG
jgi:hypothetical protein